jgi:membrane-associated protease RseP (regulator of RpoE activity)
LAFGQAVQPSASGKAGVGASTQPGAGIGAKAGTGANVGTGAQADARRDLRDAAQDTKREGREAAQDARRDARDTAKDLRQDARDTAQDARAAARDFAGENLRGADIGLFLGGRGDQGLTVFDIADQGAIAQIGFREGDRIVSINGRPVTTEAQFMQFLVDPAVRTQQMNVVVLRSGQQQTLAIQPSTLLTNVATFDPFYNYGFIVDDRIPDRLVVQRVFPRTPAFYWGLRPGDVITTVGGLPVASVNDLTTALGRTDADLPLQISRNNQLRQLQIDTSNIGARTALRPNLDASGRLDGRAGVQTPGAAATAPNLNEPAGTRAVAPPVTPTRPTPEGTPTRPGTPTAPSTGPGTSTPSGTSPATPLTPRTGTIPATPATPATPAIPRVSPAVPATPAIPATPGVGAAAGAGAKGGVGAAAGTGTPK